MIGESVRVEDCAYAWGKPVLSGVLRAQPEHFVVDEQLPFAFDGDGEHVCLHIEKRCLTTNAVRDRIVQLAACRSVDVGYCGLKDKRAVTRQWFSVWLPKSPTIDWRQLETSPLPNDDAAIRVLDVTRHGRKLRRGAHTHNQFRLLISACDEHGEGWQSRLSTLATQGVPNYFGAQRFGRNYNNIRDVDQLFDSGDISARWKKLRPDKRSVLLSSARSLLFNAGLSQRVARGDWCRYSPGDRVMLHGTHSFFLPDDAALGDVEKRLEQCDLHIAGVLWGDAATPQEHVTTVAECFPGIVAGLQELRVDCGWRALRMVPMDLHAEWQDEGLVLSFGLLPGSYATTLLRELVEYTE